MLILVQMITILNQSENYTIVNVSAYSYLESVSKKADGVMPYLSKKHFEK
jgi:hypothetical protein